MQFNVHHTHAFPGCRVSIDGDQSDAGGDATVEFSDGTVTTGSHVADGPGIILSISPYRTARGTTIPEKRWQLRRSGDGWKVSARLPAPS